ncbi:IS66 family insertion sequence element accessory protein TnpB, partial [uncultured Phocaeicola sp.]|uniref:IS66 family insertion sequence element accessory protein TnpB n=1 Tax=uncultured Phocaeicola sp. TaxID=990718 RepID=UPI0025A27356
LFREPDGFVLIYKRLSVRGGYQWPRKQPEVRNLSWREFDWLMSGMNNPASVSLLSGGRKPQIRY